MHEKEQEETNSPMSEDDVAGSDAQPPSSSNGSILVLKKEEDEEEVKSYCRNKIFTSGKGYSHTAVHRRRYSSKNLSSKKKATVSEIYKYVLCHNLFPSKYSLSAHVGWHPVKPPPPQLKIETPSASDSGIGLKGLGSDGKKNRRPIIKEVGECSTSRQPKLGFKNNNPRTHQGHATGGNGKGKGKAPENQDSDTFDNEVLNELVHNMANMRTDELDTKKRWAAEEEIIKSTPQRKGGREDPATTSWRRGRHERNDCGRLLHRNQWLGGHRRRILNMTAIRNPPITKKRNHCNKGKSIVVADATDITSSSSSSTLPSVLPFNLNNMALEKEEDEEMGAGSSSHSSVDS